MTPNEAFLKIIEPWLRENRDVTASAEAISDLGDRIATRCSLLSGMELPAKPEQCSHPECGCIKWCAVKIGHRVPTKAD